MTVQVQRFCPLCDRSFIEGEAVLRCGGCGVMHHPGCWVTNNGCATPSEHHVTPIAQAYSGGVRTSGSEARHPGEGTRVRLQSSPRPDASIPPFEPLARQEPPRRSAAPPSGEEEQDPEEEDGPVIGGDGWPPMARTSGQRERPPAMAAPPIPPRRYPQSPVQGDRGHHPRPMPRIYQKRPLLGYWYIPAAIAVAIVIALGVIWAADRIFGGGGDNQATNSTPAVPGATGTTTQPPAATASVTADASASASAPAGSGTSTKFTVGDAAVVTGTGECLNVRVAPGISNDIVSCIEDGEEVTVSAGPEEAGDLQWWKVKTGQGEGWAAEDYLVKK